MAAAQWARLGRSFGECLHDDVGDSWLGKLKAYEEEIELHAAAYYAMGREDEASVKRYSKERSCLAMDVCSDKNTDWPQVVNVSLASSSTVRNVGTASSHDTQYGGAPTVSGPVYLL